MPIWQPELPILLILFSTMVDYFVALGLGHGVVGGQSQRGGKLLVRIAASQANIGLLSWIFKYMPISLQSGSRGFVGGAMGKELVFWRIWMSCCRLGISFLHLSIDGLYF